MLQPSRQNIVSCGFSEIINWGFGELIEVEVVLGGGCALAEFYFGHRKPLDIDFYVKGQEDILKFKSALSRSYTINSEKETSKGKAFQYQININGVCIWIHCIYIDEWANEEIRNKFTLECGAIKIHTLDFIGAYKLNTLNWIGAKVGEREKSLHDLCFISHAGITTDQLIKNVKLLNINFDPENCLEDLPRRFCENISDKEMALFVDQFKCEIQNSLNRYNI